MRVIIFSTVLEERQRFSHCFSYALLLHSTFAAAPIIIIPATPHPTSVIIRGCQRTHKPLIVSRVISPPRCVHSGQALARSSLVRGGNNTRIRLLLVVVRPTTSLCALSTNGRRRRRRNEGLLSLSLSLSLSLFLFLSLSLFLPSLFPYFLSFFSLSLLSLFPSRAKTHTRTLSILSLSQHSAQVPLFCLLFLFYLFIAPASYSLPPSFFPYEPTYIIRATQEKFTH